MKWATMAAPMVCENARFKIKFMMYNILTKLNKKLYVLQYSIMNGMCPDSKPTLAQCWPNYANGTVGIMLALGEQRWANIGPTMYRQHKFQIN